MHDTSGEYPGAIRPVTANEQLKAQSRRIFWGAMLAAAVVHGLLFWLAPVVGTIRLGRSAVDLMALRPPLDTEPSPAPRPNVAPPAVEGLGYPVAGEIPRPAEPIEEQVADSRVGQLLQELLAGPTATPYEIAPILKNREATIEALSRLYPDDADGLPDLARADVWFLIDERGTVRRTLIKASTGYAVLDDAVLKAAAMMEFTPAWAGDRAVPVWVSLPIVFHNQPRDVGHADTSAVDAPGSDRRSLARHP